ncbi:hypothetical protein [Phytohabitans suffuscus]
MAYKANLSILASRYGDLERRVLDRFVSQPDLTEVAVDTSHTLLLDYLILDGVLEYLRPAEGALWAGPGDPPPYELSTPDSHYGPALWGLTEEGRLLVDRIRQARELE